MSLNGFITAEAGFLCKSGKYTSIFASNAIIGIDNLKDFYPDPRLAKDAVKQLKEDGFKVISVGKFSASILGPPDIFASSFDVEVKKPQKKEDDFEFIGLTRPGIIRIKGNNIYSKWVGEIALSQPGVKLGCPKPQGDWRLCPEEIPLKLSTTGQIQAASKGTGINIAVIDSGFDKQHSYWGEIHLDLAKIKITYGYIQDTLIHIDRTYAAWDAERKETADEFKRLNRSSTRSIAEDKRLEYLRELPSRFDDDLVSKFRADFNRFWQQFDPTGHGTAVLTNLLSIAPDANITVLKDFQGTIDIAFFLAALRAAVALQPKPDIISVSIGFPILISVFESLAPLFNALKAEITLAVLNGITVFLPSGNREEIPDQLEIQGQWQAAIIVGGTYFDEGNNLMFSDLAHGYPDGYKNIAGLKAIPDTCGLSGSDKKGYIWVPKYLPDKDIHEWTRENGTSLATPQVAALSALIKKICPTASTEQIKEILIRTSTPVEEGFSAQGKSAAEIKHQLGGDPLSPGLVNIKKSLFVANYFEVLQCAGKNDTIKNAVEVADQLGM